MNDKKSISQLHESTASNSRVLKHGIGFRLTLTVSLVLFLVFAVKAAYDAVIHYSEDLSGYTQIAMEENKALANEFETLFVDVDRTSMG